MTHLQLFFKCLVSRTLASVAVSESPEMAVIEPREDRLPHSVARSHSMDVYSYEKIAFSSNEKAQTRINNRMSNGGRAVSMAYVLNALQTAGCEVRKPTCLVKASTPLGSEPSPCHFFRTYTKIACDQPTRDQPHNMTDTSTDQLSPKALKTLYVTLEITCLTAKIGLVREIERSERELQALQKPVDLRQWLRNLLLGREERERREAELKSMIERKKKHIDVLEETLEGTHRMPSKRLSVRRLSDGNAVSSK